MLVAAKNLAVSVLLPSSKKQESQRRYFLEIRHSIIKGNILPIPVPDYHRSYPAAVDIESARETEPY